MRINNKSINSDANSFSDAMHSFMSGLFFCEIVKVIDVRGEAPDLVVDVIPLLAHSDATGAIMDSSPVYNIPVWRLQRGNSAIIMNPVAGDIGHMMICDRDITRVRASKNQALASTNRKHNRADGIYMGGLINQQPTEFLQFGGRQITLTTPGIVHINCQQALVKAPDGVTIDTPTATFTGNIYAKGDITDNAGSQQSSVKELRDAYNGHDHIVRGVQSGGDTVTSDHPGSSV